MNIRNVIPGLLAIVLSVILTPRTYANGLDETLLNISLREGIFALALIRSVKPRLRFIRFWPLNTRIH